MTLTASLDALFEDSPAHFSQSVDGRVLPVFIGLALGSWTLGEALMAPVLQPMLVWLWLAYMGCFFLFTAWYFRVSRLFDTPWAAYAQALPPMTWALMPLHMVFPAALLLMHAGFGGLLAYEIIKAGVILSVLARLIHVFYYLNHWPRWSALALALSPLAVALAGVLMMITVGGVAIVVLGLCALH